jgi:hypothetical protein
MQIQIKQFAHNFTDKKQGREDKLFISKHGLLPYFLSVRPFKAVK